MLKRLVLATKNQGKIREIEAILAGLPVEILSLAAYPAIPDVVEDGRTFLDNAMKKAKSIAEVTGETALADDSGLEVDALQGAPGVYSARYAGPGATDEDNVAQLLHAMAGIPPEQRHAAFRCVIVLCHPNGEYAAFEGRWAGKIGMEPKGTGGFGYDPVFFLPEQGCTVAEMLAEEKNRLSHRAQALQKLKAYLQQHV